MKSRGLLRIGNFVFSIALLLWVPFAILMNLLAGWGDPTSTTLGQHAFLVIGTLFLPALAIVGHAAGSDGRSFAKAALLVGIGAVGLFLAAALAKGLYPDYPERGPHEIVAAAMVLPGIAFPLVMLGFLRRLNLHPRAWLYCGAWATFLLSGTILFFGRDVDMKLPLGATVRRWEWNDIQDFSNYFLRADRVDLQEASNYAKALGLTKRVGELGCEPVRSNSQGTSEWAPSRQADFWERDDRKHQADRVRYPDGLSGCFTRMSWAQNSLHFCEVCAWGI
jgi:hypothetical protein